MRWFTDTAMLVRQRRVAEGRPDPADDPAAYGSWIADVERPARQYRSRYQTHLERGARPDRGQVRGAGARVTRPRPACVIRIAKTQQPLSTGGITLNARCPDHDCLVGVTVQIGDTVRRASAREPAARGYTTLTVAGAARGPARPASRAARCAPA